VEKEQRTIASLVDPGWFPNPSGNSAYISVYRMMLVTPQQLAGFRVLSLGSCRAALLWGSINYVFGGEAAFVAQPDGWVHLKAGNFEVRDTPEGPYAMLMTAYGTGGANGDEAQAKAELDAAVGLLGAVLGRNIVYEHVYDNILYFDDNKTSATSPIVENPASFGPPFIDAGLLLLPEQIASRIAALSEREQGRAKLGLRWFGSAMIDREVTGFIKYWLALETVAMPNTSNIFPLQSLIAKAYGCSIQDAARQFQIGRIFGLRAAIVHDGRIKGIHENLSAYMEALFFDVLNELLGLPCEHRAGVVKSRPGFDLDAYVA
jgi:hypothetical protein